MNNTIYFKIATPEKVVYEKDVFQVSLPTTTGEITVLPNHIPLVSVLQTGEMKLKDAEGEHLIAVSGGFVEVRGKNEVVVLANSAEMENEIDLERAETARLAAIEQMKIAKSTENVDFAKLQAIVDREMNRLRVGRKYRKLQPMKDS